MAKLTDQLEEYIRAGDWSGVCAVFKKLTGRDVEPPKTAPKTKSPEQMGKKELYTLLSKAQKLAPMKEYTLEDLREMVSLQEMETEEDGEITTIRPVSGKKNISPNPDFTYIPEGRNPLNMDKRKMKPVLRDFKTYDDEGGSKIARNRKKDSVRATCRECKKSADIHPSLVISGIDNEKTYICPKCS